MPRPSITGPGLITIGAIAVSAITVLGAIPPLASALLSPRPTDVDLDGRFTRYAELHEELASEQIARFDGRSFFFAPKPPPGWSPPRPAVETPPPRPRTEPTDPTPPPPPPPPVRYTGPDVVGVDGQSVYFDKSGIRIGVGETNDELGITVLSVDGAPWTVKISYRDTEFDLPLFKDWGESSKFFSGTTRIDGSGSSGTTIVRPSGGGIRPRVTPSQNRGSSRGRGPVDDQDDGT